MLSRAYNENFSKEITSLEGDISYWDSFIRLCNHFWQWSSIGLRKRLTGQNLVNVFSALAEAANIGIVLEIVGRWVPSFAMLASSGPISYLILVSDPLIYCFRSFIRLTRLVGRNFFNVAFEEEQYATPQELHAQTIGDICSMVFFTMAVVFFCGVIPSPVSITIAWTMGLCGLSIVGYFDYYLPERRAKDHLAEIKLTHGSIDELVNSEKEYFSKRNSKRLYAALIVGLSLLLICGSAAAFAPVTAVPVLVGISKLASIFLGCIAVGRFLNWCFLEHEKATKKRSAENVTQVDVSNRAQENASALFSPLLISNRAPINNPLRHTLTPQTLTLGNAVHTSSNAHVRSTPGVDGFFSSSMLKGHEKVEFVTIAAIHQPQSL